MSSHDAHVSDVRLALAKEHHDRLDVLQGLVGRGHVTIVQDENPATVTVQIDDELFSEPRDHFPTTVLMARLQLAVHAGKSDLHRVMPDHQADAISYTAGSIPDIIYHTYGDEHIGNWIDRKRATTIFPEATKRPRVTATVKLRKGLRP